MTLPVIKEELFKEVCDNLIGNDPNRKTMEEQAIEYMEQQLISFVEEGVAWGRDNYSRNQDILVVGMMVVFRQKLWEVIMVNESRALLEMVGTSEQESVAPTSPLVVKYDPRKEAKTDDNN